MKDFITDKVKHWYISLIIGILFVGLGVLVFSTPITWHINWL